MAERFDPYHKWLGIPLKERPPSHYRLLGIDALENDPDVIENAADQRMRHLRSFQNGPHAAESQRLMNEISSAKLCLLDSKKRAAYNSSLARLTKAAATTAEAPKVGAPRARPTPRPEPLPVAAATPPPFIEQPPEIPTAPLPAYPVVAQPESQPSIQVMPTRKNDLAKYVVAGALVLGIGIVGLCIAIVASLGAGTTGKPHKPDGPVAKVPATNDGQSPAIVPEKPAGAVVPKHLAKPAVHAEPEKTPSVAESTKPMPSEPEPPDPSNVPDPTPSGKPAVPEAAALAAATERLADVLESTDTAALVEAAEKRPVDERYVLLVAARSAATKSGDCAMALKICEQLAASFEVDTLQQTTDTLLDLGKTVATPEAYRELATRAIAHIELAKKLERSESQGPLAIVALVAARKTEDADLLRKATLAQLESAKKP